MVDVRLRRKKVTVWYWKCPICGKEILSDKKKLAWYRAALHQLSHAGLKFEEYMDEFAKITKAVKRMGG